MCNTIGRYTTTYRKATETVDDAKFEVLQMAKFSKSLHYRSHYGLFGFILIDFPPPSTFLSCHLLYDRSHGLGSHRLVSLQKTIQATCRNASPHENPAPPRRQALAGRCRHSRPHSILKYMSTKAMCYPPTFASAQGRSARVLDCVQVHGLGW